MKILLQLMEEAAVPLMGAGQLNVPAVEVFGSGVLECGPGALEGSHE